jgi:hypothetical protein
MAHLKLSSISNHFFIFKKRLLLPSFLSFVLAFPFVLALPSCSYIGSSLHVNISFINIVSLCNWFFAIGSIFSSLQQWHPPSSPCNFCYSYFLSTLLLSLKVPILLPWFSCFLSPCRLSFFQEPTMFLFFLETTSYLLFKKIHLP